MNMVMPAFQTLRQACNVEISPIVALAQYVQCGAIDPVTAHGASDWRWRRSQDRAPIGIGAGIV